MVGVVGDRGQVMADHELGEPPVTAQVVEQLAEDQLALEVDPGRGLVQEQQVRLLAERQGEQHPLQFAAGEGAQLPAAQVGGLDHSQVLLGAAAQVGADTEPERLFLKAHGQKLVHGERHAPVEGEPLRHVADARRGRPVVPEDAAAVADLAEQGEQQGGFAGSVGTDDGRAAAPRHGGGDALEQADAVADHAHPLETDRDVPIGHGFSGGQGSAPGWRGWRAWPARSSRPAAAPGRWPPGPGWPRGCSPQPRWSDRWPPGTGAR